MKSKAAVLAAAFATLGGAGFVLAPLLASMGALSPLLGFGLFALSALVFGLLALGFGLAGLFSTRKKTGRSGRRAAMAGVLIGALLLSMMLVLGAPGSKVPSIHDVTTTPARAPEFRALAQVEDNSQRDLSYPHGAENSAALQREAYPDLAPIALAEAPTAVFDRALAAVQDLGFKVVAADREELRIEAFDTSRVFRFVDDVVIVVEGDLQGPDRSGSKVHIRSTSRVGQSDLGANAKRIREIRDRLLGG